MSELMMQIDTSALKSSIDLRHLASQYTVLAGKETSKEWYGPCPKCGGDDRFHVTSDWFFCREGKGCHPHKGDAIEFMMWLEGLDFPAACEALAHGRPPTRPAAPPPVKDRPPERLNPPGLAWQVRAQAFITFTQRRLWQPEGRAALEYLQSRHLTETTIRAAGLGYNPRDIHDKPGRWGLKDKNHIWLPGPGVVIPWLADGYVWRVNLRLIEPRISRGRNGRKKLIRYRGPAGFRNGLYNAGSLSPTRPAILVEGELDALTLQQEAGDLVAAVATGSTSGSRRGRWIGRLAACPLVLVAFDAEKAGDRAAEFWLKTLPNARRLRPFWLDANAMATHGADLRAWVKAALPPAQPAPPSSWPVVITWPAHAPVAAIGRQWERRPDGRIRVVYDNADELRLCLELMQLAREVDQERGKVEFHF